MNKKEDDYLFSKELRDSLKDFGKMDVRDALQNRDFWKALAKHGGMSDEQVDEIFRKNDERAKKGESGPPISSLWEE